MNLHTLAKLSIIGLADIYTVRLISTIYHGIFRPAVVAGAVVGRNILAGLIQLLFHRPLSAIRPEGQTTTQEHRLDCHYRFRRRPAPQATRYSRFAATAGPFLFHSKQCTYLCFCSLRLRSCAIQQ